MEKDEDEVGVQEDKKTNQFYMISISILLKKSLVYKTDCLLIAETEKQ
jgi:hypothetical protein